MGQARRAPSLRDESRYALMAMIPVRSFVQRRQVAFHLAVSPPKITWHFRPAKWKNYSLRPQRLCGENGLSLFFL